MDKLLIGIIVIFAIASCCVEFLHATSDAEFHGFRPVQMQFLRQNHHREKRKILHFDIHNGKQWPTNINYFISNNFSLLEVRDIHEILNSIEEKTCLTFNEVDTILVNESFMHFKKNVDPSTCMTYVGLLHESIRQQGQPILLGEYCFLQRGNVAAVIASTLGMIDEIVRPDRDNYVTINFQNAQQEGWQYLVKKGDTDFNTLGLPYDYGSGMHTANTAWLKEELLFNPTAFSVVTKDLRYMRTIGQYTGLSFYDIHVLNRAYCNNTCSNTNVQCQHGGYIAPPDCQCRCPDGFSGRTCESVASGSPDCLPSNGIIDVTDYDRNFDNRNCLKSPNYNGAMGSYSTRDECTWILRAPAGKYVEAWFAGDMGLDIELFDKYAPCPNWVEIKHHGRNATSGPRYCSFKDRHIPSQWRDLEPPTSDHTIISEGSEMMVLFRSPDFFTTVTGIGFQLCYRLLDIGPTPTGSPTSPNIMSSTSREHTLYFTTPVTDTNLDAESPEPHKSEDDDGTLNHIPLFGLIVGLLLVVLIILVLVLICVAWRRKRQRDNAAQQPQPELHVAYVNPAFADRNISAMVQESEAHIVKKNPNDQDFSHVGNPGYGFHAFPESPPQYESLRDVSGLDTYGDEEKDIKTN